MSDKFVRVQTGSETSKYSRVISVPSDFCKLLGIQRNDILSCKLNKNKIILERVKVE
jgi:hypothetical protein